MAILKVETFTQLTAVGDQLRQQYELRKRFCVDVLKWTGRNVYDGMEYDQYDMPGTVYIVVRDRDDVARAMARFTPCTQPYMIKDHWPELVKDRPLPNRKDQWEVTRFCVERCLGDDIAESIYRIFAAADQLARHLGISEYWWICPQERIDQILSHNNHKVGPGKQIEYEFCYAGYSDATNMVNEVRRWQREFAHEDAVLPELPSEAFAA